MNGIERIARERQRQIEQEGWTPEHDAEHNNRELAFAAAAYALATPFEYLHHPAPSIWPWDEEWWKPSTDAIRNLEKAGALIAAEIDRLERRSGDVKTSGRD